MTSGSLFHSLSQRKRTDTVGVVPLNTLFLLQIRTEMSNGSSLHVTRMKQTETKIAH